MAKAILVMDMPNKCSECHLCDTPNAYSNYLCRATNCIIICTINERQEWCPLREVPKKVKIVTDEEEVEYFRGYNACIDELLGGGE